MLTTTAAVGFPTLVLPRSGCEGRPSARTLSLMAPLAYEGLIVVLQASEVNWLLGPCRGFSFWGERMGLFRKGGFVDCGRGLS